MSGTSGFKGSGITDPFQTPDAPTVDSVSAGVLSADVTISAPADTGGAAIDSYVVTAKQGDGTSVTGTASAAGTVSVTLTAGGTTTFAAQALNKYGAGQFSGFGNSTSVFSGQELYVLGGYNGTGGLGDGTVIDKSSPVQIGSDVNWSMASVGNLNFTAAVKTDGTLWSWGYNNFGQLGNNNTTNKSSPVQIGALTNWSSVAAGDDHCIAIKTDGTLWAWGNNNSGQITGPIASAKSSPIQIGSLTNWSSVACGLESSYALTSEGELYAWGNNGLGELGDNTVVFRSSPVQIGALTNWSSIDGGSSIVHAIKTDGTLWGWGTSVFYGSVGDGNKINTSSPVQIGSLTTWSVIGDAESSAFAIKTDGTLWSWGRNETFGTLGINSVVNVSSPVQIGSETNWSKVDGGGVIASAITTSGELYSWGRGASGRTGQNTTANSSSPVQIGGLTSWSELNVGNNSIVAFIGITS